MRNRILAGLVSLWLFSIPVLAQECEPHELVPYEEPATCTEPGMKCQICVNCGHSQDYETLPFLGHDFSEWNVVQEPVCGKAGLEQSLCLRCGQTVEREIPKLEHQFQQTQVVPTCKAEGYTHLVCELCGKEEKRDVVPALPHSNETTVTEPTCKGEGYTLVVCTVCGERQRTDPVAALGHDYQATVTEPTCTAGGYTRHECSRCGDAYRTDSTEKLGHAYDEGQETKEPTLTTMGRVTYSCVRCEDSYTETTPKWTNPFLDLDKKAYYFTPVLWASNNGVTTGTSAELFSPEGSCTRGQVVTFLWRMAGKPLGYSEDLNFHDVSEDAYYSDAVNWAVSQGITNGIGGGLFGPERVCTRCEVVTFLHRYLGSARPKQTEGFWDVPKDAYFLESVYWALEQGITQGTEVNRFSPNDTCTRAQIVTFLYRAKDLEGVEG